MTDPDPAKEGVSFDIVEHLEAFVTSGIEHVRSDDTDAKAVIAMALNAASTIRNLRVELASPSRVREGTGNPSGIPNSSPEQLVQKMHEFDPARVREEAISECEKVAESVAKDFEAFGSPSYIDGWRQACEDTVAALRSLKAKGAGQ